ncbi:MULTISPECIES: histidinol-phosphate transaminase [Chryseobacterium]|uniref:Histidinol-phosphate aminotransferase n=1 Tax=Chryseobacterium camelliae TaxID=1265445 RepID=A0ABU0TH73_9FLAO|nr:MULTISPECIES: histidinol-phosphate transaminase [Chryseobacterium]MDT3406018.1 histidinol-phosphate aminotransferase [Pseudacidovorax intermedius]MDQ1096181.1 histidinol-phosphate aminotransferase [Chryseobacterium camelliae]MDQ1100118.1 histidinol-phosphate aminotransferase [Chryseobacterium sp. SORGH_AS_1048]MDR6087461.1 histidinol-phosphate aminotransferase [Chryseobacterium sp. SORGH_AS_0909]MDR6131835.1 histidinol-phosphate aminotransferase [Chryseobacterium sp. SORGH_AS_1175]
MTTSTINALVRKNILQLQPYISYRDQLPLEDPVLLDANESPFGAYNRYPDSTQSKLKNKLSEYKNIGPQCIAIGNGSDELIDLVIKIFCEPKKDAIMIMNPSFAMYGFYAAINENKVIGLNLNDRFEIKKEDFIETTKNNPSKVFFICSPNNPTGNSVDDLEFFIRNYNGIVVVDEAYIEFSGKDSALSLLEKYPNLIILQTFSKAWGMAGARVGVAYASEEIITLINSVKAPYNVNSISQELIIEMLDDNTLFNENLKNILAEKQWLEKSLRDMDCIDKVFPTDANFFLIRFNNAEIIYQALLNENILTSKRMPQIPQCIRINVGSRDENQKLINVLKNIRL